MYTTLILYAQEFSQLVRSPDIPAALRLLSETAKEAAEVVERLQAQMPSLNARHEDEANLSAESDEIEARDIAEVDRAFAQARREATDSGSLMASADPANVAVSPAQILAIIEMAAKAWDMVKQIRQRRRSA